MTNRWMRKHQQALKRFFILSISIIFLSQANFWYSGTKHKLFSNVIEVAGYTKSSLLARTSNTTVCLLQSYSKYNFKSKAIAHERCADIEIHPYQFVHLKRVVLDPKRGKRMKGGENLQEVKYQKEKDEDLELKSGYFSVTCKVNSSLGNKYAKLIPTETLAIMQNVALLDSDLQNVKREEVTTVAIERKEYANLYHTLADWYNVFLVANTLKTIVQCEIRILFLDCHPYSNLDVTWSKLYGNITRAAFITQPVLFQNLVLSIPGTNSMVNDHQRMQLPMVEEFKNFVLRRHGIQKHGMKCCERLNVVLVLRRNYVAHPRNVGGNIKRKIQNEEELIRKLKLSYPNHYIQGVQLDKLSMQNQLELISGTNIFIGMHGAGLSHILFLPPGSAVIELFPKSTSPANTHFKAMARWRGLTYTYWQNTRRWDEHDDGSTNISPNVLIYLLRKSIKKICKQ